MAPDRLTPHQLNRTGLARQFLLERVRLDAASALQRVAGLQSQDLPAPFVGLWSRVAGFRREDLLEPIRGGRVVKATLMRATLHLVTRPDFDLFRSAIQPALDRSLRSNFGRLADIPEATPSPEERLRALVRRYQAAFGPARVRDMQMWSGLSGLSQVFDGLRPELRAYRDEHGPELFDLPEAEIVPAEVPAPPRFLPNWDNLLMGQADRGRFVRQRTSAAPSACARAAPRPSCWMATSPAAGARSGRATPPPSRCSPSARSRRATNRPCAQKRKPSSASSSPTPPPAT